MADRSKSPQSTTPRSQIFGILLDRDDPENIILCPYRPKDLIFHDIAEATKFLKQSKGSRMKTFRSYQQALDYIKNPPSSLNDSICSDLDISASLERLSISSSPRPSLKASPRASPSTASPTSASLSASQTTPTQETATTTTGGEEGEKLFPSVTPAQLTVLRRAIESKDPGDYEKVESIIWNNPRHLVTVCDSAVYLMAGPKYNACHIAARANKPEILALIMETVSNHSFMKKLYPQESNQNILDRIKHLVDSYLNTPEPRKGNTPLQFACKLGHYKVVKVLLTFEACNLNHRDSDGKTAEENICSMMASGGEAGDGGATGSEDGDTSAATTTYNKIKNMFKKPLNSPYQKDQLKKRLSMDKRLLMDKRLNKSDSALLL